MDALPAKQIYIYKSGQKCPHCMWTTGVYLEGYTGPRMDRPVFINEFIDVYFMSIYKNTFNCVLKQHDSKNISLLLQNAVLFIEHLNKTYNVTMCNLLLNSHWSNKRYEKEHLHCMVTLSEIDKEDVEFNKKVMLDIVGRSQYNTMKSDLCGEKPENPDPQIELVVEGEGNALIREENLSKYLHDNYRKPLRISDNYINIDPQYEYMSFYLFLHFLCEEDTEGNKICESVEGYISTPSLSNRPGVEYLLGKKLNTDRVDVLIRGVDSHQWRKPLKLSTCTSLRPQRPSFKKKD
jgi:hypothetical protein